MAALSEVKAHIKLATTPMAVTYKVINPSLEVQPVYASKSKHTSEPYRIAFSRFRLGAHRLRGKTGRWSHIPRDVRVCRCGPFVQDEDHVIRKCSLTRDISHFDESCSLPSSLSVLENPDASRLCYEILRAIP